MERTLYFKYIAYDSVPLNIQDTEYRFFTESEEQEETVTGMVEADAVKWLLNHSSFRNWFIADFFEKPERVKEFYGLQNPFVLSGTLPGDIDLLLVDPLQYSCPVAFECKRVKAVSGDNGAKVNNVTKIRHGVKQANAYRELGFHKTYLMIILLEDGRAMTTPNPMFRYSKDKAIESLYDIPWIEPLHEDVGIIYVKVNQTTGKHINHGGGIGFCIDKKAREIDQTLTMNACVKSLLR